MSDVKICNRHGGMFAAKEPGSAQLSGVIYRDVSQYGIEEQHVKWDVCAKCVIQMLATSKVDYPAIAVMEKNLGIGEMDDS